MVGKVSVYLRVKPCPTLTPDSSYYRINSANEIQLLVPPSNRDPYYFNDIYYQENDTISKELSKNCTEAAINGTNVSIIGLGAKGSGKTFSIFGDPNTRHFRNSLCYRVVQDLFDAIRSSPKEKNCSITVSFIDIEGDGVKDLGLAYFKRDEMRVNQVVEGMMAQELEIKDVNGRGYVEDVCIMQILNPEEVPEIISLGLKVRELFQSSGDTVFSITLSQRVKNDIQSARIYLVDFSSSSVMDLSEDSKMSFLRKVVNKVNLTNLSVQVSNIPFKAIKLTQLLQGSLLNSLVMIITHIDADPKRFQDSLAVLNYSKAMVEIDKKVKLTMLSRTNSARTADWARRLREEINELDSNIKKTQTLYEEKLRNFGKLIGIEEDLEVLINAEKGSKEYELCRKHREAMLSLKNLSQRNMDLEVKSENFKKIMNDLQVVHNNNLEKNKRYIIELKNEIREAKDQLEMYEDMKEKNMTEKVMLSTENLKKMFFHSHYLLEEQSAMIQTIKGQMESNTTDIRSILEIKELGKAELETEFKQRIVDNEYAQKQRIKSLEDHYLVSIKAKDKEILSETYACAQKLRDLSYKYSELEAEAVKMFDVVRLQGKAIYEIEHGKFNKGICPVVIPRNHIPIVPDETHFPLVFRALGTQALEVARVSSKVKSQFSFTSKKQPLSMTSSKTFTQETEKKPGPAPEISLSSLMDTPLQGIRITELRSIGNQLQKLIKQNTEKVFDINKTMQEMEVEIKTMGEEMKKIEVEKDRFKECYQEKVRSRIDKAEDGDGKAQGKLFMTEWMSRPGTQRILSTNDKMMRNIHTTISGHRLPLSRSQAIKFDSIRPSTVLAQAGWRFN
jgi:hypothetical protein